MTRILLVNHMLCNMCLERKHWKSRLWIFQINCGSFPLARILSLYRCYFVQKFVSTLFIKTTLACCYKNRIRLAARFTWNEISLIIILFPHSTYVSKSNGFSVHRIFAIFYGKMVSWLAYFYMQEALKVLLQILYFY